MVLNREALRAPHAHTLLAVERMEAAPGLEIECGGSHVGRSFAARGETRCISG